MKLHLCDVHLERTRLHLASGEVGEARGRLEAAKGLVEACGYRRRDGEVGELEARLEAAPRPGSEDAPHPNPFPAGLPLGRTSEAQGASSAGERGPEGEEEPEKEPEEERQRRGEEARRTWEEKLDYLLAQEPLLTDPAEKFRVAKQIEEARRKIGELEGEG